jgi:hypothetical protein
VNQFAQQLNQIWRGISRAARALVLRGVATLNDALYFTDHPDMTEKDITEWLMRENRIRSYLMFASRVPSIEGVLSGFDELAHNLYDLMEYSTDAVGRFMKGELTFAQLRYAASLLMKESRLAFFGEMNNRTVVAERRQLHRIGVSRRQIRRLQCVEVCIVAAPPSHTSSNPWLAALVIG